MNIISILSFLELQAGTPQDNPQEIDVNPGVALERIDSWVDGFVRLLPNIAVAIVVLVIFWFLSKLIKNLVLKTAKKRGRDNLGEVMSGFVRWLILIFGVVMAATIVVPTLNPGDIIAGLGVSSVAIGFAFKDILQNWLAGMLILLRQPFEIGDQIEINGFEGTVDRIETRATIIKTYDHQRVVVPNSEIYTNSVKVKTANEVRRSQYDIGIGYADDIKESKAEIKKAIEGIEGVDAERGVEVLVWGLDASWVTLRARWWTESARADVVRVQDLVMEAVKYALDDAGIDMPYDTKVHLLHDQTEESDGDRNAQREGWPAAGDETPAPRWKKERDLEKEIAENRSKE